MHWLNSHHKRFLTVGMLALCWWYSLMLWGRVRAAWRPPALELEFAEFLVGEVGETEEDEQSQNMQLSLSSPLPECETVEVTFSWGNAATLHIHQSEIGWESPSLDVEFALTTNCSVPLELVVQRQTPVVAELPWGASANTHAQSVALAATHRISLLPDTPTSVVWFLGANPTSFALSLASPGHFTSVPDATPQPLISTWWTTPQLSLSGATSCHTLANLFWPNHSEPCTFVGESGFSELSSYTENIDADDFSLPKPQEVLISEVNWAGSFAGSENLANDEWIELMNLTPEPLRLSGTIITNAVSGGGNLVLPENLVLSPYGWVVIARLGPEVSRLTRSADWVAPQLSLSNSEASHIWKLPDGSVLDQTPTGSWKKGLNTLSPPQRASAQRRLIGPYPGDSWLSWKTCPTDDATFWCRELSTQNLLPDSHLFASPWQASPW